MDGKINHNNPVNLLRGLAKYWQMELGMFNDMDRCFTFQEILNKHPSYLHGCRVRTFNDVDLCPTWEILNKHFSTYFTTLCQCSIMQTHATWEILNKHLSTYMAALFSNADPWLTWEILNKHLLELPAWLPCVSSSFILTEIAMNGIKSTVAMNGIKVQCPSVFSTSMKQIFALVKVQEIPALVYTHTKISKSEKGTRAQFHDFLYPVLVTLNARKFSSSLKPRTFHGSKGSRKSCLGTYPH